MGERRCRRRRRGRLSILCAWLLLSLCAGTLHSGEDRPAEGGTSPGGAGLQGKPLGELSLEDLLNVRITSVSRKSEEAGHAAAAIHVLTGEDLRRSGARSVAEALRLAPGLHVAQLDAHQWAITSRGFNSVYANKLLVLIDGRSVYTPTFSGVFWDVQDTPLEDVDRIEVIRGPGAALWGANAVNGVINIITKPAKETQGGLVTVLAGTEDHGGATVRYGFKLGESQYLRVYGMAHRQADSVLPGGENANDNVKEGRVGARYDWKINPDNALTLQGDAYYHQQNQTFVLPATTAPFSRLDRDSSPVAGGNVLGRWTHTIADNSELMLQAFYDRTARKLPVFSEERDTFDLDFQWRLPAAERHDVVFGFGYRAMWDRTEKNAVTNFDPRDRLTNLFSAFAQDEITVLPEKLKLTLGVKLEYNSHTQLEVQPSIHALWTPHTHHTVWAAVSRAVRTPSRAEDDAQLLRGVVPAGSLGPGSPAAGLTIRGDRDFSSEELLAFELGYRSNPLELFSYDLALYTNLYDELRTLEPGAPRASSDPGLGLELPFTTDNKLRGLTYGGELAVNIRPLSRWRLSASYTFLRMDLDAVDGSADITYRAQEKSDPRHQFQIRSYLTLPHNVELDAGVRYVSRIEGLSVPGYFAGDVRIGWKPRKDLELSLSGQNLFDPRHPEYAPSFIDTPRSEVEHSVTFKITFRY